MQQAIALIAERMLQHFDGWQVMTTAVKLMGRKGAKEEAADLVDQVDKIQKKFDDGPARSQAFRSAASGSRR